MTSLHVLRLKGTEETDFSENGMGKIKVNGFNLYRIGDEGSDEKEYHATVAHHYDSYMYPVCKLCI